MRGAFSVLRTAMTLCVVCGRIVRLRFNHNTESDEGMQPEEEEKKGAARARLTSLSH